MVVPRFEGKGVWGEGLEGDRFKKRQIGGAFHSGIIYRGHPPLHFLTPTFFDALSKNWIMRDQE